MEILTAFIFMIQGLIGLTLLIALIYFIVKRIEAKQTEDFEKRDN